MTRKAEVLLMHARETESIAQNCLCKGSESVLPQRAQALLTHAAESLTEALGVITRELGREMLR